MIKRPRRNHTAAFKARHFKANPSMAALMGKKTLTELAQNFEVCPNQILDGNPQKVESAAGVFCTDALTDGALLGVGRAIAAPTFPIKGPVR